MVHRILLILFSLCFFGCATQSVYLRDPQGDVVECKASDGPIDACVKRFEDQGFRPSQEPYVDQNQVRPGMMRY